MPRKPRIPSYCHHKPSGTGYARFGPADPGTYFVGAYNSPESLAHYERELARYLAGGRVSPKAVGGATVGTVVAAWLARAAEVYVRNGRPTSELGCQKAACRPLVALYGPTPAAAFGPRDLEAVQHRMAAHHGWALGTVRLHVSRIKSMWKWAQARGLVPRGSHAELLTATRLLASDPLARDTEDVTPAPAWAWGAVWLCSPPPQQAMIRLQVLNGMRPGEVTAMRPCDIDRAGPVWRYRVDPDVAKTAGRLEYWLGPQSQAVLAGFLAACPAPDAFLFVPPGAKTHRRYTVGRYRQNVARLCERLGVEHWCPHQLRHNHATTVRRLYGAEAARTRLNHTRLDTTEIYAERDADLARRIGAEVG